MTRQALFHKWFLYALALFPVWLLDACILSRYPLFGVRPMLLPLAVVAVAVPDRPGGLSEVLQIISRESIDVEYMYSVFGQKNGLAYMIFRVGDPDRLDAVLRASGLSAVPGEELGVH